MYKPMKLTILILAVITLAACSSSKTRYRDDPNAVRVDPAIAAERDAALAARDKARAERDAAVTDFGDDFSGSTTTSVAIAAVTRTRRNIGQVLSFRDNFSPHQDGTWRRTGQYVVDTAGMRNPNALDIRTMAQLYPRDGGNPLLFAATGASTLEFPGRGEVFRTNSFTNDNRYPGTRLTIQGTTNPTDPYAWKNWEHPVVSSFQFTRSGDNPGMVMKTGGDENGGAIFSDLESYGGRGCSVALGGRNCNADNTHDLTIPFGANRHRNPNDGLAYYWRVLVPNHHLDRDGDVLVPGETVTSQETDPDDRVSYTVTENVGTYTLELTHSATDTGSSTNADKQRYLSYAAYGLFHFFDRYTDPDRLGRMQTISYGFDAFADTANMRTTDRNIEATFKGRTIAYLVFLGGGSRDNRVVTTLVRMRGNIQLMANIGGADADANTITGSISNLEYILPGRRSWNQRGFGSLEDNVNSTNFDYATAFGTDTAILNLTGGVIAADGSYAGTVTPTTEPATYFDPGAFKGNLYGPVDGLETAGTWYVPAKDAPANIGVGGIIGSFGACQDGKGRC